MRGGKIGQGAVRTPVTPTNRTLPAPSGTLATWNCHPAPCLNPIPLHLLTCEKLSQAGSRSYTACKSAMHASMSPASSSYASLMRRMSCMPSMVGLASLLASRNAMDFSRLGWARMVLNRLLARAGSEDWVGKGGTMRGLASAQGGGSVTNGVAVLVLVLAATHPAPPHGLSTAVILGTPRKLPPQPL